MDSRKARRMMQSMGMQMEELRDVTHVILQSPRKEIVIEGASVTAINVQGQKMYQIAGGKTTERNPRVTQQDVSTSEKSAPIVPEEDVLLVAQQANVTMDKARDTLVRCEGDLARAILMLQTG
ncbi:MAG: nascent polypeptide-associated complex protein [Candidatus Bathyarchaeota archaeon]|nr:nascent polypeptide-associated complex protein [Candidatus Bathyarchaeota archaeon]